MRGKLTLLFLLLPSLAIAMVCAYTVVSYRAGQRQALLEEARTTLSFLVRHFPISSGYSQDKASRLEATVRLLEQLPQLQPRIRYAAIVDSSGRDLSDGRFPNRPRSAPEPGTGFVQPGLFSLTRGTPIAHASIRLSNTEDAFVCIGLEAGAGWGSLTLLHVHVGAILLVTLALNYWMIRGNLQRLIGPLEALAQRSKALAEGGEAESVAVEGPEEVAQLSMAFNRMLARREQDASRIRNTHEALQAEHQKAVFERRRFLAMVESLHEGLIFVDSLGSVEYANPRAARLLRLELDALKQRSIPRGLVAHDKESAAHDGVQSLLEHLVGTEKWNSVKAECELDLMTMAITGEDGGPCGRMILMHDRTKERRLQRQLAEQDKIATVGLLAAGIAHEINNPLDGLQNCLRRIVNDPENTTQIERDAGVLTASLCDIETVVKQLLNLSHKRDRAVRSISVNEVLAGAVNLAMAGGRWKNIETDWQTSPDLPPLLADPQNMMQVFLNLILNAVDAMPDGGSLTIKTMRGASRNGDPDDCDVVVEITDTGQGVEPDVLPQIFEPFFTTKVREKGTGLGLTVSRNLVIEHGGEIEVESTPGKGSTFRVSLPRSFKSQRSVLSHSAEEVDRTCASS